MLLLNCRYGIKSFEIHLVFTTRIKINNILNQNHLGYGFGLFYRYDPYAFDKTAENFSYKLSLTIGL